MRRLLQAALMWALVFGIPPDGGAETRAVSPDHGAEQAAPEPGRPSVEAVHGRAAPDRAAPDGEPAPEVAALHEEVRALRTRLDLLEETLAASLRALQALHVFELPPSLEFAGQPVPLARWDVAERLEREFLLTLGNRAQVILWMKRGARYFPYIEAELRRTGLPDDLKYVAVIESALLPNAYSHASALGIWQFIAATARRFGLLVTPAWDERRNPERSTAAALAYLRDLHTQFRDWPLALASYNSGEGRVSDALRRQGVSTYYQLALPTETERYVFRAFAAKLILSDPERYGFQLPREHLYHPHEVDVVEIQVRDRLTVTDLARASGSFYREIKELNPQITQDQLPKGRYLVRIPRGRATQFARVMQGR